MCPTARSPGASRRRSGRSRDRALEDRYIFSWKPTPAVLADVFHPHVVRDYIREAADAARGCIVEIIFKDTFTIRRDPRRVEEWTRIARQEIERTAA